MFTSNAVLFSWHQANCSDPVLQGHPLENVLVCSTCGQYVQLPVKEPVIGQECADFMEEMLLPDFDITDFGIDGVGNRI
jgi:hypothetical protein